MGIGSVIGGVAGGIGGFLVGGPAGAGLGYAGGSVLGGYAEDSLGSNNGAPGATGGPPAQYGGGGTWVTVPGKASTVRGVPSIPATRKYVPSGAEAEAQRASQLGQSRGDIFGNAGDVAKTDARNLAAMQRSQGAGADSRAAGLYGAAGGNAVDAAGARGDSMASIGRLRSFYEQGPGPSAAQAQLAQGQDANARNAMSIARSGGLGGGAAAQRRAQNVGLIGGQQTNQAAAGLRANEESNWRAQKLGAMTQEQTALSGIRTQDYGAMGQNFGAAGQQSQLGLGYSNLSGQTFAEGNRAQGNMYGLADSQYRAGEANRSGIFGAQLQSDSNRYSTDRGSNTQLQIQDQQLAQQREAARMAMLSTAAAGAATAASDIRAKENISPVNMADVFGDLDASNAREQADTGPRFPAPDFRPAQGYTYDYKDPARHGEGQFAGPMAQDLEGIPGLVGQSPDGTKNVDTGRTALALVPAVGEQQKRIDRLEALLAGPRKAGGR